MNENIKGDKISTDDLRDIIEDSPLTQDIAYQLITITCLGNMGINEIVEEVREKHKELGGEKTSEGKKVTMGALKQLIADGKVMQPFAGLYHFWENKSTT